MEISRNANPHRRRLVSAFRLPAALIAASLFSVIASSPAQTPQTRVVLTVVDENGVAASGAQVTIIEPSLAPLHLWTDYAGHCTFTLPAGAKPYQVTVQKPGFYQSSQSAVEPGLTSLRVTIAHEQIVKEQVNVTASPPVINTQQLSDAQIMNTPEIVNVPYPTSRDIRYLLPYNPGVIEGADTQVHVDGSETWQTLDTLDGFDIRSPINGTLDMRVSADIVRTINIQSTRYAAQFGRSTGGIIAFYTGMGDNNFRANATNFLPSYHDINGIRFDKFVPRFTFSGPLMRNHMWFVDGVEIEYDDIYVSGLPSNAATNPLIRGSNLFKVQANLTPSNILTTGVLFNDYHSPYEGLSALMPRDSTSNHDIIAWLPFIREQWSFASGALFDVGVADMRYREGSEPHGNLPYVITPEQAQGSYFQSLTGRSQRTEANATLYLPPRRWAGEHNFQAGLELDHTGYNENLSRNSVSYLREDGTLLRQSTFAPATTFTLNNATAGAYFQDRWSIPRGLLVEPGLRFDWDEIVRRPEFSPRIAAVYSPPGREGKTKISAGVGLYYDHTQLEYPTRAYAGVRSDQYYAADGVTPEGSPQSTVFLAKNGLLRDPSAVNWSLAVEQKLPWSTYAGVNFMQKRNSNIFTFVNQSGPSAVSGNYLLSNARTDRYNAWEIQARRLFANGYTLFGAYTHASAHTNAALDYMPAPSPLGPQQSGPLPWDVPNRVLSWGWLPVDLPWFRKRWDFVYTYEWHTGIPITSVNAAQQVVGAVGAHRFPNYVNFSPGIEWKFHFRGQYWGLRGVLENAFDADNPIVVNNVVDSSQYLTFSNFQGRALTARIRLIGTRK
jgi:hypothetical protein